MTARVDAASLLPQAVRHLWRLLPVVLILGAVGGVAATLPGLGGAWSGIDTRPLRAEGLPLWAVLEPWIAWIAGGVTSLALLVAGVARLDRGRGRATLLWWPAWRAALPLAAAQLAHLAIAILIVTRARAGLSPGSGFGLPGPTGDLTGTLLLAIITLPVSLGALSWQEAHLWHRRGQPHGGRSDDRPLAQWLAPVPWLLVSVLLLYGGAIVAVALPAAGAGGALVAPVLAAAWSLAVTAAWLTAVTGGDPHTPLAPLTGLTARPDEADLF